MEGEGGARFIYIVNTKMSIRYTVSTEQIFIKVRLCLKISNETQTLTTINNLTLPAFKNLL